MAPPGSLRTRLLLRLALQSLAGLGVVCLAVYAVFLLTLEQRQEETLSQKRAAVEHLLTEGRGAHDLESVRHLLGDFLAGHDELTLSVADHDGRSLVVAKHRIAAEAPIKTVRFAVPLPRELGGEGIATLTLDKRRDEALLARLAWTLLLAALGGTAVLSAGAAIGVTRELAPLRALVRQTAEVSADRLDLRLDGRGQVDELQPLIRQFNDVLDRLSTAYGQMEAFNADVAHELNTPISILINSCEFALRRPRPPEELADTLASNLEELRRIASIVADMLFLSNAQRGAVASREAPVNLARLAAEVLEYHEAALQEAGLQGLVRGSAVARVDARLLQRAISNLISNATRHARLDTLVTVDIEAGQAPGEVLLLVRNEGDTIAPEHLPMLFDRFYRADPSRAGGSDRHGLGLSIVAAIARMHGGRTVARSLRGETAIGLTVRSSVGDGVA